MDARRFSISHTQGSMAIARQLVKRQKHIRSSLWSNNLRILGKAENFFISKLRRLSNNEWRISWKGMKPREMLKPLGVRTCPAKQEVTVRRYTRWCCTRRRSPGTTKRSWRVKYRFQLTWSLIWFHENKESVVRNFWHKFKLKQPIRSKEQTKYF